MDIARLIAHELPAITDIESSELQMLATPRAWYQDEEQTQVIVQRVGNQVVASAGTKSLHSVRLRNGLPLLTRTLYLHFLKCAI